MTKTTNRPVKRHLKALDALKKGGQMTREDLASAMDLSTHYAGMLLRELAQYSLAVVVATRPARGKGGPAQWVYAAHPKADTIANPKN